MKNMQVFLSIAVFAGAVFFACTDQVEPVPPDPNCSDDGSCGAVEPPPPNNPEDEYDGYDPCWVFDEYICGGQVVTPPDENSSSSGFDWGLDLSSSSEAPGANCSYQPSWCGGITFDKVKKTGITEDVGDQDKGQDRPDCIYATAITQIGNESEGISINGTKFASGNPSRCGGDEGHGWGDATPCATKFASVAKADGGYYVYVPAWAGQKFITTGGEPVCTGSSLPPGNSSGSQAPSSSSAGGGGNCVDPMYGVPPGGVTSCVKKDGKCYTCNPDRGELCKEPWVWQVNSVEDYWLVEVNCNAGGGSGGGGGSSGSNSALTCTNMPASGIAGTAVAQPTVRCDNTAVTGNALTWNGQPNWSSPVAGTFNVSVGANSGNCRGQTAQCGRITISAAPTASTLTCAGMPATGVQGTAVTQPTVRCGTSAITSGITWTGAPTSWANPNAGTYTVSVRATSGACNGSTAQCGTLTVTPKLTCASVAKSVTSGTAVTPPTVTCGTSTVTSGITWTGAPANWNAPAQGTYSNVKAAVSSGTCSGQTADCPGTLTVNPRLTCGSAAQTIPAGSKPALPVVACGNTNLTSGITWSPASITGNINTAQTINNVTARATSGTCNGQTANCSGTITVTAQATPSSSSTSGGGVSSAGGGGSPSYTPTAPGTQSTKITQYWDACKPSCSWSGKGGKQANSCNISGANIGHSDSDRSACDGGTAFTCMKQAPWKVGNVSFGYVAAGIGACGDCWQLDFPNGQVMVVMKTNIGDIKEGGIFDLMIPGGGVGDFDALTRQVTNSGVSNPDMGVRYGGFRGACNWQYSAANVKCVEDKCNSVFAKLPDLRDGCLWFTKTLGTDNASWDNPQVKYKSVTCPKELTDKF